MKKKIARTMFHVRLRRTREGRWEAVWVASGAGEGCSGTAPFTSSRIRRFPVDGLLHRSHAVELAARQREAPLAIILNASAGTAGGETLPDRLRELLGGQGAEPRVLAAESGEDVVRLAREEIARGARTVVAAGGDGTVNAVASVLVDTDRTLGVLPLGTLNHFARDLGIPADLEGAARVLREGRARPVDVGEVNGKIFLNNSSIGLYPTIVRHRDEQQERLGRSKWFALFWATFRVLLQHHSVMVRLRVGEEERVVRTPILFVGNNEYDMEGFEIGQRGRLDAGELWVYLTKRPGFWALVRLALRALVGHLHEDRDFEAFRVREATIETRRPRLHVATDGEVRTFDSPLRYRIRPRALRVRAPDAAAEQSPEDG
jgi:YegS/Rv2252/BmrU family lipid kinase